MAVATIALAALAACSTAGDATPTARMADADIVVAGPSGSPMPIATRDASAEAPETAANLENSPQGSINVDVNNWLIPDPLASPWVNDFPYGEVYSGLIKIGDSGGTRPLPNLAESWTRSDDGLGYIFKLRDGLAFSNGSALTAADVKWSWERALTPELASPPTAEVFGAIVGAQAMLDGDTTTLAGVSVIDDQTLRIELTAPVAHFPWLLAHPIAAVLSQRNVENWGTVDWVGLMKTLRIDGARDRLQFDELPVGTGPFRLAIYRDFDHAELEPNPHFWGEAPSVARLTVTRLNLGLYGIRREPSPEEYDFLPADNEVYLAVQGGERTRRIDGVSVDGFNTVASGQAPRVEFLALNTAIPPFDDLDFRLALLHSANRAYPSNVPARELYSEEFLSDFPDGAADAPVNIDGLPSEPAAGLIPPGMDGHQASHGAIAPELQLAADHLRRSRYSGGVVAPTLTLLDNERRFRGFFMYFSRHWVEHLGIDVDSGSAFHLPQSEYEEAYEDGTLQMARVLAEPRYPDPCAILCRIPDLFGPNALSDETEQLREMLHDAAATADRAARIAKYQAIEAHILDRALVIPAYWDDGAVYELVRPYISGYKIPAYGGSRYEDVVVDTTHPDYPADR